MVTLLLKPTPLINSQLMSTSMNKLLLSIAQRVSDRECSLLKLSILLTWLKTRSWGDWAGNWACICSSYAYNRLTRTTAFSPAAAISSFRRWDNYILRGHYFIWAAACVYVR